MRSEGEKARILRAPRKTGRNKNTKEVRQKAVETVQGQNRIWGSKQEEEREEKETRKGNIKS